MLFSKTAESLLLLFLYKHNIYKIIVGFFFPDKSGAGE